MELDLPVCGWSLSLYKTCSAGRDRSDDRGNKYYTDRPKGGAIATVQKCKVWTITALTYSHDSLLTHAYPHGEQICLKNL